VPWFKSISNAAEEMENAPVVPRVPVGGTFAVGPDDYAGLGDGLSKLINPINRDGTISDEDWIMWFNRQPTDIRQMMVGDAHDLANSIGIFGVDSPANKKALIADASKNVVKQFAKDMAHNSIRHFLYNTFTNKQIYLSLFNVANSPKNAVNIISALDWRTLMARPGGIIQTSLTDAFNRSVNGFIPIDPNEAGPLQAVLNRIVSNKTIGTVGKWGAVFSDFALAKIAGMTKEEFKSFKDIHAGNITDSSVAAAYTRALGMRNRDASKDRGFLQNEFMRAIDPWFNIGSEGVSPLADMSIATRTKIFQDLAKDVMTLPEEDSIAARLRIISRNKHHPSSGIYDMVGVADDGIYRMQDMLNSELVDNSVDAIAHKDVLDIYGKLMGKTQSNAKDLLNSPEFKSSLAELSDNKRTLLIDMIKKPTVKSMVKSFFVDLESSAVTELDMIRVSEISPNGISTFGSFPTKDISKLTIGPDGRFYTASKEDLISIWKKAHPRVDEKKFISVELNVGTDGTMEINPKYIEWMQTTGANIERMPTGKISDVRNRQALLKTQPAKYNINAEYVIKTTEGDNIYKNKPIVEQALSSIRGVSPWSTRAQITDLATIGVTKIGHADPSAYGKKYVEAINKIEHAIVQVVDTMKDEAGIKGGQGTLSFQDYQMIRDEKVEQVARTVRGYVKELLPPYAEYKDVHGPIMQFLGDGVNSEIFLSRIRLIMKQRLGV